MCSLFKHYNVTPIFIFDGKPPKSKRNELDSRRKQRTESKKKYDELEKRYGGNLSREQKNELNSLKRTMVKINWMDVEVVQELFDSYGVKYITAKGEADALCASLVLKKKVYAVLTEDMDLFAYTCPIVLRYFSPSNHTCILYDLKKILHTLDIDKKHFRIVWVLAGNDYYSNDNNIFHYLKMYNKYKKTQNTDFITWLVNINQIEKDEVEYIYKILDMYNNVKNELVKYPYIVLKFGYIDKDKMRTVLEKDRFVF